MANVSLTASAPRTCLSCAGGEAFTLEPSTFLQTLDVLQREGKSQVRLMHGEPAAHPDFAWMLTRALERGFRVVLSTTGTMPYAIQKKIERLPADRVQVLVRISDVGESSLRERQLALFTRLRSRVLLGLQIDGPRIACEVLLDLIERHDLARCIYLERGEPGWAEDRLTDFALQARAAGVALELGCGFVACLVGG